MLPWHEIAGKQSSTYDVPFPRDIVRRRRDQRKQKHSEDTDQLAEQFHTSLTVHNALEKGPDRLYSTCESLVEVGLDELSDRLKVAAPVVRHNYGPEALNSVRQLLKAAGPIE
ncbi:MAG: hypothetical protein ACRD3S_20500 [Terracidiphilus sp.]